MYTAKRLQATIQNPGGGGIIPFSPTQNQHYGLAPSGTNPVLTFPQASAAGTLLILAVESDIPDADPTAVTSGAVNWTKLPVTATNNAEANMHLTFWYYPDNPGGLTTATVTGSWSFFTAVFGEFAGVALSSPLDAYGTFSGSSESSADITVTASGGGNGSGANLGAGDLVIVYFGAAGESSTPETITIASSTPTLLTELDAETNGNSYGVSWVFYGTSGSVGETDTATGTPNVSDYWGALIATFLAA